ncbi:MAG: hypothetical protein FWE35_00910 [Streptosporangiales bacterium]|nr:hypothetical protein [Streptosporangiales bacterium]
MAPDRTPRRRREHAPARRPHRIAVTLTDTELDEFRAAAAREGMAIAAWLGRTGLNEARRHAGPPVRPD